MQKQNRSLGVFLDYLLIPVQKLYSLLGYHLQYAVIHQKDLEDLVNAAIYEDPKVFDDMSDKISVDKM